MKVVGKGLVDTIQEAVSWKLGKVTAIRYDSNTQLVVCDVELESGETIQIPYRGDLELGARVAISGENFFPLR